MNTSLVTAIVLVSVVTLGPLGLFWFRAMRQHRQTASNVFPADVRPRIRLRANDSWGTIVFKLLAVAVLFLGATACGYYLVRSARLCVLGVATPATVLDAETYTLRTQNRSGAVRERNRLGLTLELVREGRTAVFYESVPFDPALQVGGTADVLVDPWDVTNRALPASRLRLAVELLLLAVPMLFIGLIGGCVIAVSLLDVRFE